jgi:hypothetical protein
MSLQGPMIVVAENSATDLVDALQTAGAFPIVETKWADAPTAFVAIKPAAVVLADPGPPPSETAGRMLCLQVVTAGGPMVPVVARVRSGTAAPLPIALAIDASCAPERLIARLDNALRVRALHATVLRRIDTFAEHDGKIIRIPVGDALDDATVLIAGRGRHYPALGVAIGERFGMVGALSVENAARHLNSRDIDGIVIGDGFSPHMVEAFLTVLAQDPRFRDIPVAVAAEVPQDIAERLPNIDRIDGEPALVVERMIPLVRLHAFEARLKRVLKSLDAEGLFDADTGLLTRDVFWRDLGKVVEEATERGAALCVARFSFDAPFDRRVSIDGARLLSRLTRNIDFACLDQDDGSILAAFTQTDLRSAHVIARRIAAVLKHTLLAPHREAVQAAVNVTLAAFKAGDTLDTLMVRVMGSRAVAAE